MILFIFNTRRRPVFFIFQSFRTEQDYGGLAEQSLLDTPWSFQVVTASRDADFKGNKQELLVHKIFLNYIQPKMLLFHN